MTATRDRRRELDVDADPPEWDQRSAFGRSRGLPWWACVLIAFVVATIGGVANWETQKQFGLMFDIAYAIGCLLAVALVRRRNVFGPMVQPPLILAVSVLLVVFAVEGMPHGSNKAGELLFISTPLINAFPAMGITTVLTVVIGCVRYLTQRVPAEETAARATKRPDRPQSAQRRSQSGDRPPKDDRPSDRGGRPAANRTGRPASDRGGQTRRATTGRPSADDPRRAANRTRAAAPRDRSAQRGQTRRQPPDDPRRTRRNPG